MKQVHRIIPWVFALTLMGAPVLVAAHPIDPVPATQTKLRAEITAFRTTLQTAAREKRVEALRNAYTDSFTHTHTSGKVDGKDARIVSLIADEPTVEVAPTTEFELNCFGESTCIVRAVSPILRLVDKKWIDVRWTQTLVRTSKGWQLAVSQATALPATLRDAP